jgi:hypothetical protein
MTGGEWEAGIPHPTQGATRVEDHRPPAAVATLRSFRTAAARFAESAASSARIGRICSAKAFASAAVLSDCALWPPSFLPRRLAAGISTGALSRPARHKCAA